VPARPEWMKWWTSIPQGPCPHRACEQRGCREEWTSWTLWTSRGKAKAFLCLAVRLVALDTPGWSTKSTRSMRFSLASAHCASAAGDPARP
jgi:hypothetical protein